MPVSLFGSKYVFNLVDAIDDCPEFLVHFPTLLKYINVILFRIGEEFGLKLIYKKTFHEIFKDNHTDPEFNELLYRMRVITDDGVEFSVDEWDACGKYHY